MPIWLVTALVLTKARLLLKAHVEDRSLRNCNKMLLSVVLLDMAPPLLVVAPRAAIKTPRLAHFCPWESLSPLTVSVLPRSALVCGTSKVLRLWSFLLLDKVFFSSWVFYYYN